MTIDELWVISDMLGDPEQAAEAIERLEKWLVPHAQGESQAIRLIVLTADLSKAERLKLVGTLTGNMTDVLSSDDATLAQRAGKLLEILAEASSRLAGNPKRVEPKSNVQARRLMEQLGPLLGETVGHEIERVYTSRSSTGERRRRPQDDDMGIFDGSIFSRGGNDDD